VSAQTVFDGGNIHSVIPASAGIPRGSSYRLVPLVLAVRCRPCLACPAPSLRLPSRGRMVLLVLSPRWVIQYLSSCLHCYDYGTTSPLFVVLFVVRAVSLLFQTPAVPPADHHQRHHRSAHASPVDPLSIANVPSIVAANPSCHPDPSSLILRPASIGLRAGTRPFDLPTPDPRPPQNWLSQPPSI